MTVNQTEIFYYHSSRVVGPQWLMLNIIYYLRHLRRRVTAINVRHKFLQEFIVQTCGGRKMSKGRKVPGGFWFRPAGKKQRSAPTVRLRAREPLELISDNTGK